MPSWPEARTVTAAAKTAAARSGYASEHGDIRHNNIAPDGGMAPGSMAHQSRIRWSPCPGGDFFSVTSAHTQLPGDGTGQAEWSP